MLGVLVALRCVVLRCVVLVALRCLFSVMLVAICAYA